MGGVLASVCAVTKFAKVTNRERSYNPYYLLIGFQYLLCINQLVTISDDEEDTDQRLDMVGRKEEGDKELIKISPSTVEFYTIMNIRT